MRRREKRRADNNNDGEIEQDLLCDKIRSNARIALLWSRVGSELLATTRTTFHHHLGTARRNCHYTPAANVVGLPYAAQLRAMS